jgi:hypothetical protein
MHSHDRTLLAKLAFADKDKSNPLHDWACQYLATPEGLEGLRRLFAATIEGKTRLKLTNSHLEQHLIKGEGQYATTIGFLDFTARASYKSKSTRYSGVTPPQTARTVDVTSSHNILVEVKIAPVPIGDALRQLALYKEFFNWDVSPVSAAMSEYNHEWTRNNQYEYEVWRSWIEDSAIAQHAETITDVALVTAYDLSDEDIAVLARENILHAKLGAKFNKYVAARKAKKPSKNKEV